MQHEVQAPYSSTILKNIFGLFPQIFPRFRRYSKYEVW